MDVIEIKTVDEIALMADAGRVTAQALHAVRTHAEPGVRLDELDVIAAEVIDKGGARPLFLGYRPASATTPFPAVACMRVNDAVVHGIPGPYRLRDGDLVSADCGAHLAGWSSDAATSFVVGAEADPDDVELIDAAERALAAGIAAAQPGGRLGDISAAIAAVARGAGYGLMADHGGHGVGRVMHEPPHVPNEARTGRGMRLQPGLVLALEPMLIASGCDDYRPDTDGWTLRTADGSRAAHVEHTVAVTDSGPRVLTTL